jgi:hypothetical protein
MDRSPSLDELFHSAVNYSRRDLLAMASSIGVATVMDNVPTVRAQTGTAARSRTIETSALTIGFEESGDLQGFPIASLPRL